MSEENKLYEAADAEKYKVEYSMGDDPDREDRTAIRIDSGNFKNTIFAFNKIGTREVEEGNPDSGLALSFDYDVIEQPEGVQVVSEENKEAFELTVGNIAVELLLDYLKKRIEQEKK